MIERERERTKRENGKKRKKRGREDRNCGVCFLVCVCFFGGGEGGEWMREGGGSFVVLLLFFFWEFDLEDCEKSGGEWTRQDKT